jgi:hypothetical protein
MSWVSFKALKCIPSDCIAPFFIATVRLNILIARNAIKHAFIIAHHVEGCIGVSYPEIQNMPYSSIFSSNNSQENIVGD